MDMSKIKVLHITPQKWIMEKFLNIYENVEWITLELGQIDLLDRIIEKQKGRCFDVVLCTEIIDNTILEKLSCVIEAYGLIIDKRLISSLSDRIYKMKRPQVVSIQDREALLKSISDNFFSGQMGSKMHVNTININDNFKGECKIYGEAEVVLSGNFTELNGTNLLTWQYNIGMFKRSKKIWMEYFCEGEIDLTLTVLRIREGSSDIIQCSQYNKEEIDKGIEIEYEENLGYLNIALAVSGNGVLHVGPLHYRDSRHNYGEYILGGKKVFDLKRQEIFYYFNPGDLKPPLNVYFSGYRSAEGFEGFFMMKRLGAPFLLITDPRLEGGSFYMGSHELEEKLMGVIQGALEELGFSQQELILSGLSMGTFGALYYAANLTPHTVIVGKPLVNVGDIAANEIIVRPRGFPTSLDILYSLTGSLEYSSVAKLNQRFWTKFQSGDFYKTQFIVAYMRDDDYDSKAFSGLLETLADSQALIISKGISGRHNDQSGAINEWFVKQYKRILREAFNREE